MFIIYGPTGVGKSDLSLALADYFPIEVVNMDVGQFYTPLSIGTAKPDLAAAPVPHHLFDLFDTPDNCTVVAYREKVLNLVKEIQQRGNVPVLVGGSGFYLKSLLFPLLDQPFSSPPQLDPSAITWEQLNTIDPDRAKTIQPQDTRRIQKALELWHATGKQPSACKPQYTNELGNYTIICVHRDRQELYQRINDRTESMIAQGWVEETQKLSGTAWEDFIETKKIIGYNEIFAHLKQEQLLHKDDLIAAIQKRTRNYAKRQIIFWRMLKKLLRNQWASKPEKGAALVEADLTSHDHTIYLKQLVDDYKLRIGVENER